MDSKTYYHGSKTLFDRFDPKQTVDGGLHVGSYEQAEVRAGPSGVVMKLIISASKIRKSRDTGGNWKVKIESAKSAGFDAIEYVNRHEGVKTETLMRAIEKGIKPDELSDREFLEHFPECTPSLILFYPDQVKIDGVICLKTKGPAAPLV